jgi:hypothetical protein
MRVLLACPPSDATFGRHNIQHNDTWYNNTKHNGLVCDTQHNECHHAECRDYLNVMMGGCGVHIFPRSLATLN